MSPVIHRFVSSQCLVNRHPGKWPSYCGSSISCRSAISLSATTTFIGEPATFEELHPRQDRRTISWYVRGGTFFIVNELSAATSVSTINPDGRRLSTSMTRTSSPAFKPAIPVTRPVTLRNDGSCMDATTDCGSLVAPKISAKLDGARFDCCSSINSEIGDSVITKRFGSVFHVA